MPAVDVVSGADAKVIDWAARKPKSVSFEDSVTDERKEAIWADLYRKAGVATAGEVAKQEVRAAVYAYCCLNGTSREGAYDGEFVTASGLKVAAAVVPQAATKMQIRKFLRANMVESYQSLKGSKVMEENPKFVAKAGAMGIAPDNAFATADWLTDCPLFTPSEARAHDIAFTKGVDRARRARGGNSLETVEDSRGEKAMQAQGPSEARGQAITF